MAEVTAVHRLARLAEGDFFAACVIGAMKPVERVYQVFPSLTQRSEKT